MSSDQEVTRREFLKRGARVAAGFAMASQLGVPAFSQNRSPNDTLGIGVIGFGIRARQMMCRLGHFHPKAAEKATGFGSISREDRTRGYGRRQQPVQPFVKEQIRAVCDVYEDARKYAGEMFDSKVTLYDNYRKVLENRDIDAVMIFTPDHWHAQVAIDACEAGKDVFIEKCPTHSFQEGVALKKAVETHKRVIQLNESTVQSPVTKKMRDLVRSGALGRVHLVRVFRFYPFSRRLWDWPIPSNLNPKTINWKEFLGSAPHRAFDPKRVIQWRCYWDYGTGICGDLFSHDMASINMIMDIHIPHTAVASGGVYELKDYLEIPDVYNSIYEYPDKNLTVAFSANFTSTFRPRGIEYIGTEASMTKRGNEIQIWAAPDSKQYAHLLQESPKEGVPTEIIEVPSEGQMSSGEKHFHEFFDAVRTRKETSCNMHMCFGEDISCHMGTEAFHQGRKVKWDPVNLKIV
jgi:predicted dehydrogenase